MKLLQNTESAGDVVAALAVAVGSTLTWAFAVLDAFADDVVDDFVFFELAFALDEEVCLAAFVDTDLWEVDLAFALLDVLLFRARSSKGLASDETAASRKVRANAMTRKRMRLRGEAMLERREKS